ncbi:hypothetical protein Lal_00042338 [Lupinus albus]|nr:hypothetical protein Lal_00042338 [Lupinus albus]
MSAFTRVKAYRSMLWDLKHSEETNRSRASAFAVEYRLMYTLLAYCLVPRDGNHNEPTEDDIHIMFSMRESLRVDWPQLVLMNMLDFSTSSSGVLGYPIFISRIIEHTLVDFSNIAFTITNLSQHFLVGSYLHHLLDICEFDGVWTYSEDIDPYPVCQEVPPPLMNQIRIRSYILFNSMQWMLKTKKKKKKTRKRIQMMINPSDKPS